MIVAGFGFRGAATVESLMDAFMATGARVDAIATARDKSVAASFQDLAKQLGVQMIAVSDSALAAAPTLTASGPSQVHRATGSVAEAAAMSAIGDGARLITPRFISQDRMATCAIAEGPKT